VAVLRAFPFAWRLQSVEAHNDGRDDTTEGDSYNPPNNENVSGWFHTQVVRISRADSHSIWDCV